VPDANTLWDFREALSAAEVLFARLDRAITGAGYRSMSGQIVDATLVSVPRQCNTDAAKGGSTRAKRPRKSGPTSLPGPSRRTAMRAGRSSSPREIGGRR
jgi:hypothetical protein